MADADGLPLLTSVAATVTPVHAASGPRGWLEMVTCHERSAWMHAFPVWLNSDSNPVCQ